MLARKIPAPLIFQKHLVQMLVPKRSGLKMIRLGPDGDGGYIVPDLMDGIALCFSPGVDYHWGFESDLWDKFKIPSVMCDGSLERPKSLAPQHKYEKTWIAKRTRIGRIRLHDWVDKYSSAVTGDLILQMDIEGAEYDVLRTTPQNTLRSFRIIVVEFHGFQTMQYLVDYMFKMYPAIRKLHRDFTCVHLHPNNCSPTFSITGVPIPMVFEATFLRRDLLEATVSAAGYLTEETLPEDFDCVPRNPSIRLGPDWPQFF